MANAQKKEILLESGTNEFEIMEFTIAGKTYGINVAKVRQIMLPPEITPMPHSHPAIEGIFNMRNQMITVIDLPRYLGLPSATDMFGSMEVSPNNKELLIITNFNKMLLAFRVHTIEGIYRIQWDAIQKPDKAVYSGSEGVATGIVEYNGKIIVILDFEKIVVDISPETSIQVEEIERMGMRTRSEKPLVLAEDSIILNVMINDCLNRAGYTNVEKFTNGADAWDYLKSLNGNIQDRVACVISDIEMPKMDGHRLLKLIKENNKLRDIPVVIFSSLINEEMYQKGRDLGATEQISKPEIGHLVEVLDHIFESDGNG